jgi:hypothetical protein
VRADALPKTGLDLQPWPTHILEYLKTFFTNNNVALPDLQRIVPGQLSLDAWDCEQLSVGCAGIGDVTGQQGNVSGAPRAGSPYSAMTSRQVAYGIQLVRCIAGCQGYQPDSETITAAGIQQLTDMGLLSQAVVNLASAPPPWHDKDVNIQAGNVTPLGPSGGYYAIETNVIFSTMALTNLEG